ncbi:uncharacterized protein [Parasteatoda tepidariorum]|uniref:uncharacterized protein n=1 Tax=Parasteatoda tepidariorum TaxID=114398 RepID=UPI00077FC21A|nr:uncharacterized protein LOC107442849 [Parasteatoda tepidariorum]
MLLILFLRLALLPVFIYGEECTLHELHACLESLQSVTQNNDLALVTTKEELLAVCRKLKDSVGCVDNHMKHCFSPTQTKVFNSLVSGARQFLSELCVIGPIQEAYLKHAPCFQNVSLSENKCAPKYRHLMQLSENVEEQRNVDDGLRESCCAFNEFVLCKYEHVRKDCGLYAAEFLQQHLDRISSPLIHEHCAHYMYATNACVKSSSASNLAYNSVLKTLFALQLIFIYRILRLN